MAESENYAPIDRPHTVSVAMCKRCRRMVLPGEQCVCFAMDSIRKHFARRDIFDQQRIEIIDEFMAGYCKQCGRPAPEGRCYCQCDD